VIGGEGFGVDGEKRLRLPRPAVQTQIKEFPPVPAPARALCSLREIRNRSPVTRKESVLVIDIAVKPLPALRRESILHPVESVLYYSLPARVKLGQHLVVDVPFGLNCCLNILMSLVTDCSQTRRYIAADRFHRGKLVGRDAEVLRTGVQKRTSLSRIGRHASLCPFCEVFMKKEE
jgi:hypothetical protein